MHRVPWARWLQRALRIGDGAVFSDVPLFLCPAVGLAGLAWRNAAKAMPRGRFYSAGVAVKSAAPEMENSLELVEKTVRRLPITCSGCGAFVQTTDPQQLGHFDLQSKRVRRWLHPHEHEHGLREVDAAEDQVVENVLKLLDSEKLNFLELATEKPPICDRCHDLIHHSTASDTAKVTVFHPTVESLRETIEESPFKYNHIYHLIDAADFPMSLIPRLNILLGDIPLRSRNRRSRAGKYQNHGKTEMSFIITRGDLLGPTKENVDSMMPYLRDVLRDALGRLGGRVRLGNVKCVSAQRAWWTKELKEDIWNRGGAGWMVGKVNVGKSQLFEAVYPKGRMSESKKTGQGLGSANAWTRTETDDGRAEERREDLEMGELLPPAQPATNYPEMPVVSSLPGTTASPIRIPFGNGKGELVDLPGLARSDLDLFVKEEHRQCLIMKKRIVPKQVTVKSGKSIILGGGLIRITPRTPDMVFLMYNFTALEEHLAVTDKAIAYQDQTRQSVGVENIALPGTGDKMKHAGTFRLCHDVTKKRAGPLTRKNAVGLQVDKLPFRVVSVDILIEGVGYVEVVAQVRWRDFDKWSTMQQEDKDRALTLDSVGKDSSRRHKLSDGKSPLLKSESGPAKDPFEEMRRNRRDSLEKSLPARKAVMAVVPEPDWPSVDVYSPEGRFIGCRRPIHGWLNNKPRVLAEHKRSRPRRSMKGAKKRSKVAKRRERITE